MNFLCFDNGIPVNLGFVWFWDSIDFEQNLFYFCVSVDERWVSFLNGFKESGGNGVGGAVIWVFNEDGVLK